MKPLEGRMDFDLAEVPAGVKESVEAACNAEIDADRANEARELPAAEAFAIEQVRIAARDRLPTTREQVRIVDIVGLDVEADGGTHVASPRQIKRLEIVKIENKGKGFRRLRLRLST